jgi:hypothetical protein
MKHQERTGQCPSSTRWAGFGFLGISTLVRSTFEQMRRAIAKKIPMSIHLDRLVLHSLKKELRLCGPIRIFSRTPLLRSWERFASA